MESEAIGMITLFGVISVLLVVTIYAVNQFLRADDCRRYRPTLATFRPGTAGDYRPQDQFPKRRFRRDFPVFIHASTKRKAPMSHQHQTLQGAQVRDLVTGLEGIVTAVMYCVNGCVRVCVQPTAKDNKPATDIEWCDVQQVRRIGSGVRQQLGIAGTEAEPPVDYPRTAAAGGPQKSSPRPT